MVTYTGKETRIQMNAARTPLKVGECKHCVGGWVVMDRGGCGGAMHAVALMPLALPHRGCCLLL